MKKRWGVIRKGDILDLGGKPWTVEKIKPGKRKAEVKIRHRGNVVKDTVRLDDKVRVLERASASQRSAPAASEPVKPRPMPTEPPKKATGNPWETQQDRIEQKLDEILGARLVGESKDGGETYYVPPVDGSTVASHLLIFHAEGPQPGETVEDMLMRHGEEHKAAERGEASLRVTHWHTEKRPKGSK